MRTIIVEDEPLARERLRSMLESHPDVELVDEFDSVAAARKYLRTDKPDLLLLDIELSDDSGLSLANVAQSTGAPFVIFTTAFPDFAVQAFDARALDYLMKPVDPRRLREALDRVRNRMGGAAAGAEGNRERRKERFAVQTRDRSVLIRATDIEWIESVGNYIKLHIGTNGYLVRKPLYSVEEELDPELFVRIHRKYIVNVGRIVEIVRGVKRGEFSVKLRDSTVLKMQAPYAARLQQVVGKF